MTAPLGFGRERALTLNALRAQRWEDLDRRWYPHELEWTESRNWTESREDYEVPRPKDLARSELEWTESRNWTESREDYEVPRPKDLARSEYGVLAPVQLVEGKAPYHSHRTRR